MQQNHPAKTKGLAQQLFVNLPVKDLKKTIAFFSKIGFTFNPKFTDQNAACMIIGKNIYAMLITEKFFKTFTPKKIANAQQTSEVLVAVQLSSKHAVDDLMKKVIKAGGKKSRLAQDLGWMYSLGFEDLDGHIWEAFYMNEKAMPKG
jgi:hypothetical protein